MEKCQCNNPGFCNFFNNEMYTNPPNWQWCQNASPNERKAFFDELAITPRVIIKPENEFYAPVRNFFDKLPPRRSDTAICTIAANKIAIDQLKIVKNNIIKYANKCGADYIELTGDQFPEYAMYNKYRLYQITSKYEKTLYLDCDIVIKNNCPNLFEIAPDNQISGYDQSEILQINDQIKQTNYSEEMKLYTKQTQLYFGINNDCYIQPNGGVLIIPKALCDLYKQPNKPYIKTWCFDQYYLSCYLNNNNFFNLNPIFNWEFIRHDFWDRLNDAYIIHVDGSRPQSYRLELLSRLINNDYKFFPPPIPELNSGHDGWRPVWFNENAQ